MAFDVKSAWAGALTDTSVRIVADTAPPTNGSVLVADNQAMTGAATYGPVTATADGILNFPVTGLTANTRYWYVVSAGGLNTSYKGSFRTHPAPVGEPVSYIFGAAGDAGLTGDGYDGYITSAVSNSPVFDTMRAQAAAEDWAWFSHLGDIHYRNITVNDPALYRAAYDDNHNYALGFNPAARQGQFLRGQAITYVWDDHDFGPNNSDRTNPGRPAAQQVYRECVPHYPLADPAGIYQSWQVGRVLYIASDVRSFRDPNTNPAAPSKTMLGTAQKTWMETLLLSTGAEALVWQCPSRWVGGFDTWSDFIHERAQMVELFGDTGWLDRMIYMTADMHSLSMCSGPANPYGAFPMYMFASLDAGAWSTGPEYDLGSVPGRRQYGTMRVQDNGHTIALTGTGYRDGIVTMAHTAYIDVGSPVIALNYAGDISPPFKPDPDDQNVYNDITATRQDGGQARFVQETGPLNVGDPAVDPDAIGVYDGGDVTINVAEDEQLADQAAWRVHLGTVEEERYPLVRIDLAANPDLADEMTELGVGDRMTIANPPEWLPPETIQLIAEGGTETIGLYDWDVVLNASAGTPWTVAQAAALEDSTAGPNNPNRADTSDCHLVAAVNSAATSFVVHTPPDSVFDRAPWIISTGPAAAPNLLPAQFPFDVRLGGENVRVTAAAPLAWDAFTRTTTPGWGTPNAGAAWANSGGAAADHYTTGTEGAHLLTNVDIARLSLTNLATTDADLTAEVATAALATGGPQFVALVGRAVDDNNLYMAQLSFNVGGGVVLSLRKRVGGVETQLATLTTLMAHTAAGYFRIRLQTEGSEVRAKAWKRGTGEPPSWQLTATDTSLTLGTNVGCRSVRQNANTNAGLVASWDNFGLSTPQRLTVQRSLNTVVKGQDAGTPLALVQPAILAL